MTSFGPWLRQRRLELHLTQAALAERVGCARDVLRQFEAEVKRPSVQLAERLAEALDIPATERASFIQAARGERKSRPTRPNGAPEAATAPSVRQLHRPHPQVELIGRETERSALQARLRAGGQRLVTLIGPGGIGKTSLALQVAADLAADPAFGYEVAIVPLAPIDVVSDVPLAVTEALGEPLQGARSLWDRLLVALGERAILLVLDNCEHLLGPEDAEAFTALIHQMIAAGPRLQLLATSRERLRLRDERVVALAGLALPGADTGPRVDRSDAVRLFVERAQRVAPDFTLSSDNRAAVAQICRRLEGLPLAIELAASWMRMLTPREIAAQIARPLDFLAASERDVPFRHSSLRAALDHSWQLLSDHERKTLARLSIFSGGWDFGAAAAILSDEFSVSSSEQPDAQLKTQNPGPSGVEGSKLLTLLASLVDKSLVQRGDVRGTTRYTVHELVHQYVEERLADDPAQQQAAAARHAAYYSALLQRSIAAQTGGSSPEALANLTRNIDNVRSAWMRAATLGDTATVLAMARNLMFLYDVPGWVLDGAALFERAATALRAAGTTSGAALGVTLGFQGYFLQLTRPAAGVRLLEEAVALLEATDDSAGRAQFLLHLGTVEIAAARFAAARERYALVSQLATASGDHFARLWAIFFQGVIALFTGDFPAAERSLAACLSDWRSQGFNRGMTSALTWLSEVARQSGRAAEAASFAREGLQISSTAHDMPGIARSLRELGALAFERHDLGEADYLLTESCAAFRAMGSPWAYGRSRSLLIRLEVQQGHYASARKGCAELLRLIHNGAAIMLPEAAYGLALILTAEGSAQEAMAILVALADTPGENATLALARRLRTELEWRLTPPQRAAAEQLARTWPLLPWLEKLSARPVVPFEVKAPIASVADAPIVPAGALYVAETGETLSPREVEVLRLVARGASNSAIATRLIISPHTVKRHVANICQKLSVAGRTEAAIRARELGIVV